jgi:hypothetical protein
MSDYFTYVPLTANTVARAADVNARFQGVETGFSMLPPAQYLYEDRQTFAVDEGVANAYVANPAIPITEYNVGLHIVLQAANANTGVSTLNVSGLGVKEIVRSDGTALQAGDIVDGQMLDMTYDGNKFQLAMAFADISPAGIAEKIAAAGNIVVNGNLSATSITCNGQTIDALTPFGVSLVESADAAAARGVLGLGTMATQNAALYALINSPALTGVPTAPTAGPGTNTLQLATTAFVQAAITAIPSSGVTSFNTRTGAVTLTSADVTTALTYTPASTALVTTSAAGLAPTRPGGTTAFLRADGTWAVPPDTFGVPDGDKTDVVVSGGGTVWKVESAFADFAATGQVTAVKVNGNRTNLASQTARNPGVYVYSTGGNDYGMELGYATGFFGTRIFTSPSTVVTIGSVPQNATLQSDFVNFAVFGQNGVAITGGITTTANITMGGQAPQSVPTPLNISMGATFSDVAGDAARAKLKLFNDGTQVYGLGVSNTQLDYMTPVNGSHNFYIAGAKVAQIISAGIVVNGMTVNNDLTVTNQIYGGIGNFQTPNAGSTGGIRIKGNATSGYGILQSVNQAGDSQWSYLRWDASGLLHHTGAFSAAGNITSLSDARLKSNIRPLYSGLEMARRLRGVRFDMEGVENIGVIAQEVQLVVPEVVLTDPGGMMSVDYGRLTAVLIEAVKDLADQLEQLREGK